LPIHLKGLVGYILHFYRSVICLLVNK
jgi:hypothetical protein